MQFNVGKTRISSIEEQTIAGLELLIKEANPKTLSQIQWLAPHYINQDSTLPGWIQTFVINTASQCIVVDTCVGNDKERPHDPAWHQQQRNFLQSFQAAGFARDKVDVVLCTHLHVDHVGWNTMREGSDWVPTFPNARYLFAKTEFEQWQALANSTETPPPADESRKDRALRHFDQTQRLTWADSILPILDAGQVDLVDSDHRINDNVRLVPTPGHTNGHVSVLVHDNDEHAVISGDCVHHPCQIAHPDWRTLVDYDWEQARDTRQQLFTDLVNNGGTLIGSHFATPCCGKLTREGNGFRFWPDESEQS